MDLTIEALGPQNAVLFLDALEHLDFHHAPDWAGCFCRYYHHDCTSEEWMRRSADQNKVEALAAINDRSMKGFLAFHEGQWVGWVNANRFDAYPRLHKVLDPLGLDPLTGCIVCFVIHPDHRRQGVATALLGAAVESFRAQGFEAVIGFPFENKDDPEKAYRGSIGMYTNLGFEILETENDLCIVRKELNP